MGRFVTLTGGADYLEGETTLNAGRKTSSEDVADVRVESAFAAWDRTSWISAAALPPEVKLIALKLASGEYLRRTFNKASPDASMPGDTGDLLDAGRSLSMPTYASDLIAEAEAMIGKIEARGYLVGADGSQLAPIEAGGGSIFAEVWR